MMLLVSPLADHLLLKHAFPCGHTEKGALCTGVTECPALAGADKVHVALVGMLVDTHCLPTAVKALWILLSRPPPSLRNRVTVNAETPVLTCNDWFNTGSRSSDSSIHFLSTSHNRLWGWHSSIRVTCDGPQGAVRHIFGPVANLKLSIEEQVGSTVYLGCLDSSFIVTVASHITATIFRVVKDPLCCALILEEGVDENWLDFGKALSFPTTPRHIDGPITGSCTSLKARTFPPSTVAPGQLILVAFNPAPLSLHTK